MSDTLSDAVSAALERFEKQPPRELLDSILALQKRRAHEDDRDRALKDCEDLIADWCDRHGSDTHASE